MSAQKLISEGVFTHLYNGVIVDMSLQIEAVCLRLRERVAPRVGSEAASRVAYVEIASQNSVSEAPTLDLGQGN